MAKVELILTANATDLLNDLNKTEQELKNIQGDAAKMGATLNRSFAAGESGAKEFNQEVRKTEGLIEEVERSLKDWERAASKATNERDLARYNRNIEESRRELERLRKTGTESINQVNQSASAGTKIFAKLGATVAAAFSVQMIVNFARESYKAYEAQQIAEKRLELALGKRKELMQFFINQASELQKKTTIADEEIIAGQAALLKLFRNNAEAVKVLTPLVLDWAKAQNMDVVSAAESVAKAINSQGIEFKRLGFDIQGAAGSSERFDSVMRILLGPGVKDVAEEIGKLRGRLGQAEVAWNEFKENIGKGLKEGPGQAEYVQGFGQATFYLGAAKKGVTDYEAALKKLIDTGMTFKDLQVFTAEEVIQIAKNINLSEKELQANIDKQKASKELDATRNKLLTYSNEKLQEAVELGGHEGDIAADILKTRQAEKKLLEERIEKEKELFNLHKIDNMNFILGLKDQFAERQRLNDAYTNFVNDIAPKMFEYLKNEERLSSKVFDNEGKILERRTESGEQFLGGLIRMRDEAAGLVGESAISEGETFWEKYGFALTPEQKDLIKNGLEEVKGLIESWADFQVEQADRVVNAINSQVEAQQQAVETEISLLEAGYAANVTLEKKKLEDLKLQRQKALEEQEKAVRRQQTIEAITQGINLASSASSIIKGFTASTPPWIAVALSAIAIAAMLKLFSGTKSKAAGLTKFAKGGLLSGPGHERGGIVIPGTGIEVEGNEFVINKYATKKYLPLLETINKDNLPGERKMNIGVNLDNSKQLERIGNLLETKGQQVEYYPGRMVIRKGNNTKTIFLS